MAYLCLLCTGFQCLPVCSVACLCLLCTGFQCLPVCSVAYLCLFCTGFQCLPVCSVAYLCLLCTGFQCICSLQGSKLRGVSRHWSLSGRPWRARIHWLGRVNNTNLLSSNAFCVSCISMDVLSCFAGLSILAILQQNIAQHICTIEQLYVFGVRRPFSIFRDTGMTAMACLMPG